MSFTILKNCFWLMVPVILINLLLMHRLPRRYQARVFDNIPKWVGAIENILRIVVFLTPLLMPLEVADEARGFGLLLYSTGLVFYFLSWVMQIGFPESHWSRSRIGFMAPAYTPLIWLAGIALIGRSLFHSVPWSQWIYAGFAAGFLIAHNAHAWIAYSRALRDSPS